MPFVETNGVNMYYEVHGEGPALVLAHPGGGSHLSWWQQVPVFAESFTCIVFDHRGHGLTRDVPDDPGAHAYPQDLLGLLDHLDVEKAALVGQSMGGWTSIGLAAAHPQRVSALVLGDSTGGVRDTAIDQHMTAMMKAGARRIWAGAYTQQFAADKPAHRFLYHEITTMNLPKPANLGAQFDVAYQVEAIVEYQIPALFIVGEEDSLMPAHLIERVAQRLPGSQIVKISDAAHSAYYEKPDEFNQIVLNFLHETVQ